VQNLRDIKEIESKETLQAYDKTKNWNTMVKYSSPIFLHMHLPFKPLPIHVTAFLPASAQSE